MDKRGRAVLHCHGQITTGKTPEEIYANFFALNAPEPEKGKENFRGVLTQEDVYRIFGPSRPKLVPPEFRL